LAGFKILREVFFRHERPEVAVGLPSVVAVQEGVDERAQQIQPGGQVLDGAVQLGTLGPQAPDIGHARAAATARMAHNPMNGVSLRPRRRAARWPATMSSSAGSSAEIQPMSAFRLMAGSVGPHPLPGR
jgi:hypothetical protein